MNISIVVPLYACSQSIYELSKRLIFTLKLISDDYEIIFVNDNSPENDWNIVKELGVENKRIKGINLSRNFGQHYAITAGLKYAKGEWIVVMDGDLQDIPEEIINLYNKAKEGFDIVFAQRRVRQDNYFKKLGSLMFYRLFSYLTETDQDESIGNFGIYHKKVINSVLNMKDSIRYFPIMAQWVGFSKIKIQVNHGKRELGKSSYSWKKLLKLAFDNIISFSNRPLRILVKFGFIMSMFSIIIAVFYLYSYLTNKITEIGFTSIILSIWFLSGVIIMILGIVGIYVGKTFEKVKDRPFYIVKESNNI